MATESGPVTWLTKEESEDFFDRAARKFFDMSGDEFLRLWDAGHWKQFPHDSRVMQMEMLIPFARRVPCE
ncbi:MAG: hypothetical protein O2888_02430 [Chloroflexi bacterium]|nr:hypothetical protein [Chloroflexota bacterium]